MDNKEIRKFQLFQLELLDEIERVCNTLNISYYLIGGSLLGAIRHHGFIPWDADMDIGMRRNDYEKLVEYYSHTTSDRYYLQHYTTEKFNCSPHAILRIKNTEVLYYNEPSHANLSCKGIYLDIFPLDNAPSDIKKQTKQANRIKLIKKLIVIKAGMIYSYNTPIVAAAKKVLRLLLFPLSLKRLNDLLDNEMKRYNKDNSGYLVSMASHYSYQKQLMKEEIYGIPISVDFEGTARLSPARYDEYLHQIYGEYMKVPSDKDKYEILNGIKYINYGDGTSYGTK